MKYQFLNLLLSIKVFSLFLDTVELTREYENLPVVCAKATYHKKVLVFTLRNGRGFSIFPYKTM